MDEKERKRFRQVLLYAVSIILIYASIMNISRLGEFFGNILSILTPFVVGTLFALILYKPMRLIYKGLDALRKRSKAKRKASDGVLTGISIVFTLILAFLIMAFVLNIVIPQIIASFKSIASAIEEYYPKALKYLEEHGVETTKIKELLMKVNLADIGKAITENAGKIFTTAWGAVNNILSIGTTMFTAAIFSVYALYNHDNLRRQFAKLADAYLNPTMSRRMKKVGMLTVRSFLNFLSGQCLEAILLGTIFFIVMTVFGFPYATVISVIISITAIIPYVGAFIGLGVGFLLIMMSSPVKAIIFIAVFLVIQQLENNIIYPRVVGSSVNLPAMWTFSAVILGGSLYGVAGMLFFIPVTAVIYTLLRENVNARLEIKKAREAQNGEKEEPELSE